MTPRLPLPRALAIRVPSPANPLVPIPKMIAGLRNAFGQALTDTHSRWARQTQLPAEIYPLRGQPDELPHCKVGPLIIPPGSAEPTFQALLRFLDLVHGDPREPYKLLSHEGVDQSLVNQLRRLIKHSVTSGHRALAAQGFGGEFLGVGTFGDPASPRPHWEAQALPSPNGRPACHADMSVPEGWSDKGVTRAMVEQLLRHAWEEGHGTLIFDLDPANKQAAQLLEREFGAVRLRPAKPDRLPPTSWWAAPTLQPTMPMAMAQALTAETHPQGWAARHYSAVLQDSGGTKPPSAPTKKAPGLQAPM